MIIFKKNEIKKNEINKIDNFKRKTKKKLV